MKRTDYISWDEYFMGISLLSGMRSKDPSTHEDFPWEREGDFLNTKYPYVVHAEQNAILNARGKNLEGCSIYVNLFPCHDCARNIIQSGIKKVYYLEDKYKDTDSTKASKFMFEKAKVECIRLKPRAEKIEISFKTQD